MINEDIIKHLRELGYGRKEPHRTDQGLCSELRKKFDVSLHDLVEVKEYPLFSGHYEFPVVSSIKNMDSEECYYYSTDMWSSDYGDNRKDFCLWVADEMERKL